MQKTINQEIFKTWTRDSAYLIGYICADGCVHKRLSRKNSYILTFTSKDFEHLEKINEVLNSNYAISKKRGGSGSISYNLSISNTQMCYDLIALGIGPNKTLTLGEVDVPEEYFSDFVRGYFDADGSVYIYQINGTPQIKISLVSASKIFLDYLIIRLSFSLQIVKKPIHCSLRKDRYNYLYSVDFYIRDGKKLFDFMYSNNPKILMQRKFDVFTKWHSVKRRKYTVADL